MKKDLTFCVHYLVRFLKPSSMEYSSLAQKLRKEGRQKEINTTQTVSVPGASRPSKSAPVPAPVIPEKKMVWLEEFTKWDVIALDVEKV
jgi:hypothetical protein